MCKKRLRAAIDMYECILLGKYRDGSYGGLNRTEILKKFKSRLNELELKLKPCPFCGELPIYEESCFSHHGLCSGDGGYSENIKCVQCDYIFMGGRESGSNCITHLKQAAYNVAKSSFDEGAEWAFSDPHPELSLLDASVVFAKNIYSEMVTASDSIHKQPIAKENDCE